MGALNYNFKKLYHPDPKQRAEILATNFASMDTAIIKRELDLVKTLRPNLTRYVYHTSLNFSKEEFLSLSNEMLRAIAEDYLNANGYINNQYFIFRHHDADHPHVHLLVNRIGFDGSVVFDSNNYKKSEAILRGLEYRYNLKAVEQSSFIAIERTSKSSFEQRNGITTVQGIAIAKKQYNNAPSKAVTKDEVAMMMRTGKSSNKLLLQELMKYVLASKPTSISELISRAEQMDIHFLFNQASTGRISGITYFFKDFKAKGQALGNQFKWAELIKQINYDQIGDRNVITEANSRTMGIYGEIVNHSPGKQEPNQNANADHLDNESSLKAVQHVDSLYPDTLGINIQLADDVDDENVYGKRRRRGR